MAGECDNSKLSSPLKSQLGFWPENMRGVPSVALKSSLFAPIQHGQRRAVQRETISSVGKYHIIFTGILLNVNDLEVYEELLHRIRYDPKESIRFSTRDFLKSVGRSIGKNQRNELINALSRLAAAEVEISNGKYSYAGSLIEKQCRDESAGWHYVKINPEIAELFKQGFCVRDPRITQALGLNQLAKWLLGFVGPSQKPLTFFVKDLEEYSRSDYRRKRDFRNRIQKAADRITEAGKPIKVEWSDDRSKVTFIPAWKSQNNNSDSN